MTNLVEKVEDLILYYNIPTEEINILTNSMKETKNESERISQVYILCDIIKQDEKLVG
ncbi:MAG: hypothetical protein KAH05_00630 [Clostridiales bacterium]|nr:hypothetical protein [Clostridiales bacterium]